MPETTKPVPTRRCAKHWLDADGKRISERKVPAFVRYVAGRGPRESLRHCDKCGMACLGLPHSDFISIVDCWHCGVWAYNPFDRCKEWWLSAAERKAAIGYAERDVQESLSPKGRKAIAKRTPETPEEKRHRRNRDRRDKRRKIKYAKQAAIDAGLAVQ